MKVSKLFMLALSALLICSCSYDSQNDFIEIQDDDQNNNSVNYTSDIRPIMQSSCISCHASPPENGAPFSLINFNQVSDRANLIINSINRQSGESRAMPPSGRLPQATIDLVQEWIDADKPEN